MSVVIEPGPAKIAVEKLEPSQEIAVAGLKTKLWIPTSGNHEGLIGRVVAVCKPYSNGNGETFQSNYDIGDMVVIGKYTGTKMDIGRVEYTILREEDVLCRLVMTEDTPDES